MARPHLQPRVFQAQRGSALPTSNDYRAALVEGGKNVFIYYCNFR